MAFNVKKAVTRGAEAVATGGLSENDNFYGGGAKKALLKGKDSAGKAISDLNPFKKPNIPTIDDPTKPANVVAPTMNTAVTAPTVAPVGFTPTQQFVDPTQQAQFRDAQVGLMGQLQQQAAGQGPSLAGEQLRMGNEQAIAAQQAAMASQRGGFNPALARQSAQQSAQIMGAQAGQAAQLRMQEQLNAQQALGQLSGQARGQDIGIATTDAGLGQASQQLGADLAMQTQKIQSAGDIAAMQQSGQLQGILAQLQLQAAQGNQAAGIEYQRLLQGAQTANASGALQADAANKQLMGGLIQAGGQAGAAAITSDIRAKKDIKDDTKAMREFISAAKGYDYNYKNEGHGKGAQHSPMAQDLEKTKLGKQMIIEAADGTKMVDYSRSFGIMLSALNDMDSRIKKSEKK